MPALPGYSRLLDTVDLKHSGPGSVSLLIYHGGLRSLYHIFLLISFRVSQEQLPAHHRDPPCARALSVFFQIFLPNDEYSLFFTIIYVFFFLIHLSLGSLSLLAIFVLQPSSQ